MKELKYTQVFMIADHECTQCGKVRPHSVGLTSNNKKMDKAVRVKACDACGLISEAPIG